jgi:hypothetical protein
MAKIAKVNVVGVHQETREPRWFREGDTIPVAYESSITNPAAYKDSDSEEPLESLEEPEFEDNYEEVTNDDLRTELADRGLPVHGNKPDLIARLREDDARTA